VDYRALATQKFSTTVATTTTEGTVNPLPKGLDVVTYKLTAATANARCRFNRPLDIPSYTAYQYVAAAGTYTELAAPSIAVPWDLSGMVAADRLYIGADGEFISDIEVTIATANGNASVLSVAVPIRADELTRLGTADWGGLTVTDGTISGGCAFGQTGRISLVDPPSTITNARYGAYGRVWYRLTVSATLDASTTISALTLLAPHFTAATTAAEEGDLRWHTLYHRIDSGGPGTLKVEAVY